jgi:hypothetical protein
MLIAGKEEETGVVNTATAQNTRLLRERSVQQALL